MQIAAPISPRRVLGFLRNTSLVPEQDSEFLLRIEDTDAVLWCDLSHPDVLQLRGRWRGSVPTEDEPLRSGLVDLVAKTNSGSVHPKSYTLPSSDRRRLGVGAEVCFLTTAGMTEAQFYSFIEAAHTALTCFFASLSAWRSRQEHNGNPLETWDAS